MCLCLNFFFLFSFVRTEGGTSTKRPKLLGREKQTANIGAHGRRKEETEQNMEDLRVCFSFFLPSSPFSCAMKKPAEEEMKGKWVSHFKDTATHSVEVHERRGLRLRTDAAPEHSRTIGLTTLLPGIPHQRHRRISGSSSRIPSAGRR
jgi:hypothetical protein